ncbi:MAG: hypothetical protein V1702_04390 [Candidatus Woesearchaeota archaeon]
MKFKQELITLGIAFAVAFIILQVTFYRESALTVLRLAAGLFWLFTIPGMAILWWWKEKISPAAMVVMGTILGMAVVGIASYYLGVLGLNLRYSAIILPIVIIGVTTIISLKKSKQAF